MYAPYDIQAVSGAVNTFKQRKNLQHIMILSLVNESEKLKYPWIYLSAAISLDSIKWLFAAIFLS